MVIRTEKERNAEIAKLQNMKPNVLRQSIFGDDHHRAIEAQIEFLKGILDNTCDEFNEEPDNVRDAVNSAENWLEYANEPAPSEEWKSLIKK